MASTPSPGWRLRLRRSAAGSRAPSAASWLSATRRPLAGESAAWRRRTTARCRSAGGTSRPGCGDRLESSRVCCSCRTTATTAQSDWRGAASACTGRIGPEFSPICRQMTATLAVEPATTARPTSAVDCAAVTVIRRDPRDSPRQLLGSEALCYGSRSTGARAPRVRVPVDGEHVRSKGSSHSTRPARQSDDPDPTGQGRR